MGFRSGRGRFAFIDIHAFDEALGDGMDITRLDIRKNVASETLGQSVNPDMRLAASAVEQFHRFLMRVELLPIAGPIGANQFSSEHQATLRCLGSTDVVSYQHKGADYVSVVKGRVVLSCACVCLPGGR